jgi:hypothetical protein
MAFDAHKNFALSTVATAPSPATSGLSLIVATGDGAKFPAPPFNATIWPTAAAPTSTNAEVVRVTAIAADTLTIVRAQEGSSARTVVVGDQIAATVTAKTLTDIEARAAGGGTAGPLSGWSGLNTGADWTAADLNGGIALTIAPGGANWRMLTKPVPSSTPYVISVHFRATLYMLSSNPMSAGLYVSDGTKWMGMELYTTSGGMFARVLSANDFIGTGTNVLITLTQPFGLTPADAYLQVANDGTNQIWSWSLDGQLWTEIFTQNIGTFLTPTVYGIGGVNATLNTDLIWLRDVAVT